MDLNSLKATWHQQMQQELDHSKHTLWELTAQFQAIEEHRKKTSQENRFWNVAVLMGMGICIAGFAFFRLQYTPEKFPHISIGLYDAAFAVGMVFLSLKASLSYWYTRRHDRLQAELYAATLKDSLLAIKKNFDYMYRLSMSLCLIVLPPLFFMQVNIFDSIFGWNIPSGPLVLLIVVLTLGCTLIGHAVYRYLFNQEMRSLNSLLSHLQ